MDEVVRNRSPSRGFYHPLCPMPRERPRPTAWRLKDEEKLDPVGQSTKLPQPLVLKPRKGIEWFLMVDEEVRVDARDKTAAIIRDGVVGLKQRAAKFGGLDVGNRRAGHDFTGTSLHEVELGMWKRKGCHQGQNASSKASYTGVPTAACLGDGDKSGGMGAHYSKYFVVSLAKLSQEAGCKVAFSEVATDNELSDPTNLAAPVCPSTGECIAGEGVVDVNTNIGRPSTFW